MVNIPLVQVDSRTPLGPSQLSRILNQIQTNFISAFNSLQNSTSSNGTVVGQEITAYLTEDQFQQQMGTGWVLADGRNIAGSAFAKLYGSNTLPDRRGTVSRMKDGGRGLDPAGDLPLGTYEADEFASHTHTQNAHTHIAQANNSGAGTDTRFLSVGPGGANNAGGSSAAVTNNANSGIASATAVNQSTGAAETRAKAIIANVFVRIN